MAESNPSTSANPLSENLAASLPEPNQHPVTISAVAQQLLALRMPREEQQLSNAQTAATERNLSATNQAVRQRQREAKDKVHLSDLFSNKPVAYVIGNSDIGKSSVMRALMPTSSPDVAQSVEKPVIFRNSPGGLDAVIVAGKHFVCADFARCPDGVSPEDYIANLLAEIDRDGTKVPSEVDFVILVVSADIGGEQYILEEVNQFHAMMKALLTARFVKPFFLFFNCHEMTPVPRHDALVQLAQRRFADITSPQSGAALCYGVFVVCAAPRVPLDPRCPRTADRPLMQRHPVHMLVENLLRYCPSCHHAEVCSGAVELPAVAANLRELKANGAGISYVVYRPFGLGPYDPSIVALQVLCARPLSDSIVRGVIRSLYVSPADSLRALPCITLAGVGEKRHAPNADIDKTIFETLTQVYEIPIYMRAIVAKRCYQEIGPFPERPPAENPIWLKPVWTLLSSFHQTPFLASLGARAAFHALRILNVSKELERLKKETPHISEIYDVIERDKEEIAAKAAAAIDPSVIDLMMILQQHKGIPAMCSELARELDPKMQAPRLLTTEDVEALVLSRCGLRAVPAIALNTACKKNTAGKQGSIPFADIDKSIFKSLAQACQIPLELHPMLETECYHEPGPLPPLPSAEDPNWRKPLLELLASLHANPALSLLIARAAFHTARLWNVKKALEEQEKATPDLSQKDKKDIIAKAASILDPHVVNLLMIPIQQKGVEAVCEKFEKYLETKRQSANLLTTEDFQPAQIIVQASPDDQEPQKVLRIR